jgi:oligopeptide transport system permease protein
LTTDKFLPNDFVIIGCDDTTAEEIARPNVSYWRETINNLLKNPVAVISFSVIVLMALLVVFVPILSPYDFSLMNIAERIQPPSLRHPFGTDKLGRDMFTRVFVGARVSVLIAIFGTIVQMIVGILYGGIMAYKGGIVDKVMMKIIVLIQSLPDLVLTLLILIIVGGNMGGMLLALCITSWCHVARVMRGQMLQLKSLDYVAASRGLGAPPAWIILKHLMPNAMGLIILITATSIPNYVFAEATLSFLGLGLQLPDTSLGVLISLGQQVMGFYPYQLIFPVLVLGVFMLAVNLFGESLRSALDPRKI